VAVKSNPHATVDVFRSNLEFLSESARAEGVNLKPYTQPDLPYFSKLPDEVKDPVSWGLKTYCGVINQLRAEGKTTKHNLQGVWYTLKACNLIPRNDLLSTIDPSDIIEVYSIQGIQLYRSFEFFSLCSYDLESLLCRPFFELYTHGKELDEKTATLMQRLDEDALGKIAVLQSVEHSVIELCSESKLHGKCVTKVLAPLYSRQGEMAGFIHAFKGWIVDSTRGTATSGVGSKKAP
jgi:hypothetical protein